MCISRVQLANCLTKVVKFCGKLGNLQKKIEMKDYPTIVSLFVSPHGFLVEFYLGGGGGIRVVKL